MLIFNIHEQQNILFTYVFTMILEYQVYIDLERIVKYFVPEKLITNNK